MRAGTIYLSLFVCSSPSFASEKIVPPWPNGAEIEHFLKKADITERVKVGEGVTNPEKVTLEMDGKVLHAIYKKVDEDYDSWRFEVAAYELDKLLGLGMVPPTVERRSRGRRGCLQLWVQGTTLDRFEGEPQDHVAWRRQVSVMWLFDDLISNIDRHMNNAIVSPDDRLILIDNSKTFRFYKKLLNDLNGPGTGTHARFWFTPYDKDRVRYPTSYPAELIERLRSVTEKQIKKAIGRWVWGYNKQLVAERWKIILERLDQMDPGVIDQAREH
jgi:hypothetical protein